MKNPPGRLSCRSEWAKLSRHHREIAEQRLADAKMYEAQISKLLWRFSNLVPKPAPGKSYKQTTGEFSGLRYRHQLDRQPMYEMIDKETAISADLTREYVQIKVDTQAVKVLRAENGDDLPGVRVIAQCPVSYTWKGDKS